MTLTGTTSEAGASALDVVIQDTIRPGRVEPLCVDLDSTLVRSDLLLECLLSVPGSRAALLRLPHLLTTSRAALKRHAAACGRIDTSLLPYNEELLAYLRAQKADGRHLVLVTAADITVAQAVADPRTIMLDPKRAIYLYSLSPRSLVGITMRMLLDLPVPDLRRFLTDFGVGYVLLGPGESAVGERLRTVGFRPVSQAGRDVVMAESPLGSN